MTFEEAAATTPPLLVTIAEPDLSRSLSSASDGEIEFTVTAEGDPVNFRVIEKIEPKERSSNPSPNGNSNRRDEATRLWSSAGDYSSASIHEAASSRALIILMTLRLLPPAIPIVSLPAAAQWTDLLAAGLTKFHNRG
jgi:hypothetical protein